MDRPAKDKLVCVGKIGAAHGVRGDVRLWSYTADPLAIADYGPLRTADGKRSFEIETVRPQGDFLVARLSGIADRNAAELLRNIELYVPRDQFPLIEEDGEFYIADLVGLKAQDAAGTSLGKIVAVHNFGAGDLIELKLNDASETLLLPFTDPAVPKIDLNAGVVVVDLHFASGTEPPSPLAGEGGEP